LAWLKHFVINLEFYSGTAELALAAKIKQMRITDTTARSTRRTLYFWEDLSSKDKCSKTIGLGNNQAGIYS
jgi:hypothetical protein